jgi:RNA polymerase sigma-70 factor, ECF subfamily
MAGLVQTFLEHLGERPAVEPPELAEELASAIRRAREAWPGNEVDDERFAAELARRVPPGSSPGQALASIHVADVYLTVACALGNAVALAEFDRRHAQEIRSTVTRMGFSQSIADETLQVMREELFVVDHGTEGKEGTERKEPRILNYAGASELRSWLRAVAARTGLRVGREPRHKTTELHEALSAANDDDLEIDYLKRTYGDLFQQVFAEALAGLEAGERLLLKQRFSHQLSIEDLARLYGVHGSTASRRVTDARERLLMAVRDGMMRRLNVGRAEVSSILRLIHSQLDITLSSLPGAGTDAGATSRR